MPSLTPPMVDNENNSGLLSIGALSRATGIPTDTLRTWERRYGFPAPERTDSGHRRYASRTAHRLRLVQRALELGHAPSAVVGSEPAQLEALVRDAGSAAPSSDRSETDAHRHAALERWFGRVDQYDGVGFERELRSSLAELGGHGFLARRGGPFVRELGERWQAGSVGIRHEHFASERFAAFLASQWMPLSDAASGDPVVCATLPNERHVLGLHMAAFTLALDDQRVVFLGHDTPPEDIARAVEHRAATAVVLSASACGDDRKLAADVALLRALLPSETTIVGGGTGFTSAPAGMVGIQSFRDLRHWIRTR